MEGTKKEKIQSIIITIMALIIVCGGAFFASELKYCTVEKEFELENIEYADFMTLLNDSDSSIIYLARPGCTYCQKQEPIMKNVAKEYDLTVNYLNTDNLNDEQFLSIFALDKDIFGENGEKFGTPTTLVVSKGEIVNSLIGLTQKDDLVTFFKTNGFIK